VQCKLRVGVSATWLPVSAFYFESPEKQMQMSASVWTRSKFMGMSIGVALIGKGTIVIQVSIFTACVCASVCVDLML